MLKGISFTAKADAAQPANEKFGSDTNGQT
jgi:hypothetical protein